MISKILYTLSDGINQLRFNTHYLLVTVLVLVLPILFVWVGQSFFDTAFQNISTSQKQQVNILHESVETLIRAGVAQDVVSESLIEIVNSQTSIHKIRVLLETTEGLEIVSSNNLEEVEGIEGGSQLYTLAPTLPGESAIFNFTIDNDRVWQAFRELQFSDETYYIFSEHNFANSDAVLLARQQQTYLVLPVIFLFLIFLAYWLVKQTHWQKEQLVTKQKLNDQMMFTNTLAHELRAPLTAIRGYVSFLLESDSISADNRAHSKNINQSAERLLALINDFLEVARIQSGKLRVVHQDLDVRDVVSKTAVEFKPTVEAKGLALDVVVPDNPVHAQSDAGRLQQIITNLLSNAIKYTDTGSITITLEQTKLKTIIKIQDTGRGISAEDQKKLFAPFMRVGGVQKTDITGTGLGMWITKHMVELLGGTIDIESIEGVGTHAKLVFDV